MSQHLRRPCKVCDEIFRPSGKYTKVCDDCSKFSESNKNFKAWTGKGKTLIQLKKNILKDKRASEIKKELKELNKLIRLALK